MNKSMICEKQNEWYQVSREIAEEGIVLLMNKDNVLPLGEEKVAVFGQTQFNTIRTGRAVENIIDGLIQGGMKVDDGIYQAYKEYFIEKTEVKNYQHTGNPFASHTEPALSPLLIENAKKSGIKKAVVVIGRRSAENIDMNVVEGDYILSKEELQMIETVCSEFQDVILILNISCNIDLGFLDDYPIKAVLFTSYLGDEEARALANILKGKVNPSGKLPFTMAKHYEDYSSCGHFGQHGGGILQDYREDIFVGYRWFDTFNKHDKVVFPFGHGLSYTDFYIDSMTYQCNANEITVSARVTNTGVEFSGKEVIQIYYSAPQQADGALLGKPHKELCGFTKTKLLKPGESECVSITFEIDKMASYDDTGVTGNKSAWIMEEGNYSILLGRDSFHVVQVGEYTEPCTRVIERCHEIPTTLPKRLLANGEYECLPTPLWENRPIAISSVEETEIEIASLQKGKGTSYSLMTGTGGAYFVQFYGDEMLQNQSENIEIRVDGVIQKASEEVILPLGQCELELTALVDELDINRVVFQKKDTKTVITANSESIVKGHDFYEGSFRIEIQNYEDDGFGNSGSCVTHFFMRGMNVVYKLIVEEEGNYDISFRYAYKGEDIGINQIMTMAVSNIVQPLNNILLRQTYKVGDNRKFQLSDAVNIPLPKGVVYLKLIAEALPFPDIAQIILKRNENPGCIILEEKKVQEQLQQNTSQVTQLDMSVSEKIGIQLKDVYHNPQLMSAFLEQLDNRELATLVSGTSLNATPYGDVGCNHPLPKRGVPAGQTADGGTGLRQKGLNPTAYPACITLTASYNHELFTKFGEAMGQECRFYGVDFWLAPSINILRDPCGGRNASYCSEDPYLTGKYATYVSRAVQSYGVATVVKHYCANSSEYERLKSNSRVSERALREIYLKAFEETVKNANPWGIMSSYNNVNDIKACESSVLITDIPRDEWKWDGVFFTDWWNDSQHVEELKAGHDLKMATGDIEAVVAALNSGELSREQVTICAERVLNMLMKLYSVRQSFEF